MRIAVLAGSPTDTNMGVTFVRGHGFESFPFSVSSSLETQRYFEARSEQERFEIVKKIVESMKTHQIDAVLVYCNALSASVDMKKMSAETGMKIVTPFDAYSILASAYNNIGVLAGSGSALTGIEKVFLAANPKVKIWGISMFEVVSATEINMKPEEIVARFALNELCAIMANNLKAEIIVLGCTNFPYFKEQITMVPKGCIIDPSEMMLSMITKKGKSPDLLKNK